MADDAALHVKVRQLTDLELAVLLCLVFREHGLLTTTPQAVDGLVRELQLVAKETFGLSCAVIDCSPDTTLDAFVFSLFAQPDRPTSSPAFSRSSSYFAAEPRRSFAVTPDASAQIANCVLAKNLDRAPRIVQIQALELLRTRRVFTRTSMQAAPKQFISLPVLVAQRAGEARVTHHLNEFFALAHWQDPVHGHLKHQERADGEADKTASTGSIVRSRLVDKTEDDQEVEQEAAASRTLITEPMSFGTLMNIVSFLRMHRAVDHGISPAASTHFKKVARCLAPLHDLDYVTPALVAIAARKVYLHRIIITTPERERSMQWGSDVAAVEALLDGVGPEDVIEDVLQMVTAPL